MKCLRCSVRRHMTALMQIEKVASNRAKNARNDHNHLHCQRIADEKWRNRNCKKFSRWPLKTSGKMWMTTSFCAHPESLIFISIENWRKLKDFWGIWTLYRQTRIRMDAMSSRNQSTPEKILIEKQGHLARAINWTSQNKCARRQQLLGTLYVVTIWCWNSIRISDSARSAAGLIASANIDTLNQMACHRVGAHIPFHSSHMTFAARLIHFVTCCCWHAWSKRIEWNICEAVTSVRCEIREPPAGTRIASDEIRGKRRIFKEFASRTKYNIGYIDWEYCVCVCSGCVRVLFPRFDYAIVIVTETSNTLVCSIL